MGFVTIGGKRRAFQNFMTQDFAQSGYVGNYHGHRQLITVNNDININLNLKFSSIPGIRLLLGSNTLQEESEYTTIDSFPRQILPKSIAQNCNEEEGC